ncbi:UPF0158 family protein [Niallia oryzisoli]|uniref:UPF0158 family protein n=1 Tax=Niallia oryzisoli TaxID=1737571 RepID=A0ABZ2CBA5_9BACI
MVKPVKLKDIVWEMESQIDDSYSFFNKTTGDIVFITSEELRAAEGEDNDDSPQWMQENSRVAIDILENDGNYIELPTKFDIHEYGIMEDFCFSMKDERIQNSLLRAIGSKGAFQRFKDQIINLGIRDQWFSYRDERYKQIAKEWCRDNDIELIE